jgi:hypothetical protein
VHKSYLLTNEYKLKPDFDNLSKMARCIKNVYIYLIKIKDECANVT